ncbi:MAG TPA: hypothetical protein VD927_03315 [Chryseosolibacter sp.]|nr:hypothetical protein [Chryseosolibacter sp.]
MIKVGDSGSFGETKFTARFELTLLVVVLIRYEMDHSGFQN